jgi:hypothetical protein
VTTDSAESGENEQGLREPDVEANEVFHDWAQSSDMHFVWAFRDNQTLRHTPKIRAE